MQETVQKARALDVRQTVQRTDFVNALAFTLGPPWVPRRTHRPLVGVLL